MTMLQGLNSTVKSVASSQNPLSDAMLNIATSYFGQAVPTLSGQIARTIDPIRRSTYVDQNKDIPPFLQKFGQRMLRKLPGGSSKLEPYVDQWGRIDAGEANVALRMFDNFVSPGCRSETRATALDREVQRLYDQTGESQVIPGFAQKQFSVDSKPMLLTGKEYTAYQKLRGSMSYDIGSKVIENPFYRQFSDSDKAGTIRKVYDYANQLAKEQAAPRYEAESWVQNARAYERAGGDVADFIVLRQVIGSKERWGTPRPGNSEQSIPGSASQNKMATINTICAGATQQQKTILYKAFGIASSVSGIEGSKPQPSSNGLNMLKGRIMK